MTESVRVRAESLQVDREKRERCRQVRDKEAAIRKKLEKVGVRHVSRKSVKLNRRTHPMLLKSLLDEVHAQKEGKAARRVSPVHFEHRDVTVRE